MATCAILTAATIRFDNYSDANGRERQYIFMGSDIGQERSDGGRRNGEERRGALLPEDPFPQMPVRPLARTADYRLI